MKLYCQQCFAKVEYKFSKPKFCPECGRQIGAIANQENIKSDRIKELELELQQFKNKEIQLNKGKVFSKKSKNDEDNVDVDSDDDDIQEDYDETQRHIDNFKIKKFRSGVTVEKNSANKGISFAQLMESVSSGAVSVGDEFKMIDDYPAKTERQILEEFRAEASSKSKTHEIQ
jgi:hypothetical protein